MKNLNPLYHAEIFMPGELAEPCFEGKLRYSRHALREAESDRYGHIELPRSFESQGATLIETEIEPGPEGRVVKQLWRRPLDEQRDLVMAICPNGTVKTVWVNLRTDKHGTLNRRRYVQS